MNGGWHTGTDVTSRVDSHTNGVDDVKNSLTHKDAGNRHLDGPNKKHHDKAHDTLDKNSKKSKEAKDEWKKNIDETSGDSDKIKGGKNPDALGATQGGGGAPQQQAPPQMSSPASQGGGGAGSGGGGGAPSRQMTPSQLQNLFKSSGGHHDRHHGYESHDASPRGHHGRRGDSSGSAISGNAQSRLQKLLKAHIGITDYSWGAGHGAHPGLSIGIHDGGVADSFGDFEKKGLDCSGWARLVTYVMTGADPGPVSTYTIMDTWTPVAPGDLKIGDSILPTASGRDHVQVYIGNGQVAQALQSGTKLMISPMPSSYVARRFKEIPDYSDLAAA